MGFFTQRCPNCGKSISKEAKHCSGCGCPTATAWTTCSNCGSSVGADSKFCWRCGTAQDPDKKKQFYGDRWHRSPSDFAVRLELKAPAAVLHKGLQIDEGTLALIFQGGKFKGLLEPGHHMIDGFITRLLGFDKGLEAHAILLDSRSAEVDFMLENVRLANQLPVDLRLRLLFKVTDARRFVETVVRENENFSVSDLSRQLQGEVSTAIALALASRTLDSLLTEPAVREAIEQAVSDNLRPRLVAYGIEAEGVRLAQFGGPAYEELRGKLGEIDKLNRELEVNRQLRDATRAGKIDAYRDEEQTRDAFEKIAHEMKLTSTEREQEFKRFAEAAEHKTRLQGLRLDYEARRAEIVNRLDEQKLRHTSEIADAMQAVALRRVEFEEDIRQQRERFGVGQEQQVVQSKTDLEVARQGIEALKLVKQAKIEVKKVEDAHELAIEAERMKLRGSMSMQALLATLSGEQADRVLKLAELEMRKGLSPEQALAMIAEKSPEIAPAIAEALKARSSATLPSQ